MVSSLIQIDMKLPRDSWNIFVLVTCINSLLYLSHDSAESFFFQVPIIVFWIIALYSGTFISKLVFEVGKIWQKFRRYVKILLLLALFSWCFNSKMIRNIACGYFTTKGFGYIFIESNHTKLIVRDVVEPEDTPQIQVDQVPVTEISSTNSSIRKEAPNHVLDYASELYIAVFRAFVNIAKRVFKLNKTTSRHVDFDDRLQVEYVIPKEPTTPNQSITYRYQEKNFPINRESIIASDRKQESIIAPLPKLPNESLSTKPKAPDSIRSPQMVHSSKPLNQNSNIANGNSDISQQAKQNLQPSAGASQPRLVADSKDAQLLKRKFEDVSLPAAIDPDFYRMAKKLILIENEELTIPKPKYNESVWPTSNFYERGRPTLSRKRSADTRDHANILVIDPSIIDDGLKRMRKGKQDDSSSQSKELKGTEPTSQSEATKVSVSFTTASGASASNQSQQVKVDISSLPVETSKVEPTVTSQLPFTLSFTPTIPPSTSNQAQIDSTVAIKSSSQPDISGESQVNTMSSILTRKNSDSSHPRTPSPSLPQPDAKSAAFSFGKPPPSPSAQRKSHVEIPFGIAFSPKGIASPPPTSEAAASTAITFAGADKSTAIPPMNDLSKNPQISAGFSFGSIPNPSISSSTAPITGTPASLQNLEASKPLSNPMIQFGNTSSANQPSNVPTTNGFATENKPAMPFTFGSQSTHATQHTTTAPSVNFNQPSNLTPAPSFVFGQQPTSVAVAAVPQVEPFQTTNMTANFQFGAGTTQPSANPNQAPAFSFGQTPAQPVPNFGFGNNTSALPAAPFPAVGSFATPAFGLTPAFGAGSSTAARKGKTTSRRK